MRKQLVPKLIHMVLLLGIGALLVVPALCPAPQVQWKGSMTAGERYQRDGRYRLAERSYQRAISVVKNAPPPDPRPALSTFALAELYRRERSYIKMGYLTTAPSYALVWKAAKQGPQAMWRVAGQVGDIRHALKISRDLPGILATYRHALASGERAWGKDSPRLLPILERLGSLAELRDPAEKLPCLLRRWQIAQKAYGADDPRTTDALDALANYECKLKRFADAERHRRDELARLEARYGPASVELLPAITSLARVYRLWTAYDRGELLYRRGIAIAERVYHQPYTQMTDPHLYGTPHWDKVSGLLNDYAWQLEATGRTAQAQAMKMRLTD
jgi:tetratricopeptide (TPR) repeat protein